MMGKEEGDASESKRTGKVSKKERVLH